jgi:hypothetical protein
MVRGIEVGGSPLAEGAGVGDLDVPRVLIFRRRHGGKGWETQADQISRVIQGEGIFQGVDGFLHWRADVSISIDSMTSDDQDAEASLARSLRYTGEENVCVHGHGGRVRDAR